MIHVLLTVAMFMPPGGAGEARELCDFMWMSEGEEIPSEFQGAGDEAAGGNFAAAFKSFHATATALSSDVESLFSEGTPEAVQEARGFLDEKVNQGKGVLHLRGDRFTLGAASFGWGAYLACRAGEREKGLTLLKSGWRDWAEKELRTSAAFLLLALGPVASAADFVEKSPEDARGMAANAAFYCRGGDKERGRKWLKHLRKEYPGVKLKAHYPHIDKACE